MQKIEFYVGTMDQFGLQRKLDPADAVMSKQFDGFTRTLAEGWYKGQMEATAVYTVIVMDSLIYPDLIHSIAQDLAEAMDQKEVLWSISNNHAGMASYPADFD